MSDGDEIRTAAGQVSSVARDLRRSARQVRSAHGVSWHSDAAGAYRKRLADSASRIETLAREVDDVAASLRRYASSVERRQQALARGAVGVVDAVVDAGSAVVRTAQELA